MSKRKTGKKLHTTLNLITLAGAGDEYKFKVYPKTTTAPPDELRRPNGAGFARMPKRTS